MSLGWGGHATLITEDCRGAQYIYGSYNHNNGHDNRVEDGEIYIAGALVFGISSFSDVDFDTAFETGEVEIVNCSNCWETIPGGIDRTAMHLVFQIIDRAAKEGVFPDQVMYNV